jgi:hypothetical protein
MKRFVSVLTVVAGLAATSVGTAGANDTNVAVQSASTTQLSSATAFAEQFASSGFITENVSIAESANYAVILQSLSQSN